MKHRIKLEGDLFTLFRTRVSFQRCLCCLGNVFWFQEYIFVCYTSVQRDRLCACQWGVSWKDTIFVDKVVGGSHSKNMYWAFIELDAERGLEEEWRTRERKGSYLHGSHGIYWVFSILIYKMEIIIKILHSLWKGSEWQWMWKHQILQCYINYEWLYALYTKYSYYSLWE